MDIMLGWSDEDRAHVVFVDRTAPETAHNLKITLSGDEAIGFVLVSSNQSRDNWLQLDPDATTNGVLAMLDDHDSVLYALSEFRDIVPDGLLHLVRDGEDVILDGFTVADAELIDRTLATTRP